MSVAHYVIAGLILSVVAGCDSGTVVDNKVMDDSSDTVAKINPQVWPKQDSPLPRNDIE